jgi:glycosyltransferase involved in cell wall biosynthesis
MRIAQIAPIWIPVPPRTHGGTEHIVSLLTEELLSRGHEVTLFASGDSRTNARLISSCSRALWRDPMRPDPHACIMGLMAEVMKHDGEFDIIHNHADYYFAPFAAHTKTPVIQTLHRPLSNEARRLYAELRNIHFVAISHDQAASADPIPIARVIYNGIPIERFSFSPKPKGFLLFLSRIAPDKGIIEAIEAAKLAGRKLIIAGNIVRRRAVGEDDYDFFVRRVKPRIDGKLVIYAGEADFPKKLELYQGADALLFPIRRREPFGLVIAEALACGTPVIAFRGGSTTELIEDGKTGFLVEGVRSMARAIERIGEIDRAYCRSVAEKRFSHHRMVDEYESLYREILSRNNVEENSKQR